MLNQGFEQNQPRVKENSLNISITKIFSWPAEQANFTGFSLVFYPEDTQSAPLIEKSVAGSFASNSMNFNALLKISYTEDERIVHIP